MRKLFFTLFTVISFGLFAQVPTNGLVGYWSFSGNANDASGNGNHGTVTGATLTTDRFGNANSAYNFNGTSNLIVLPNTLTSQFSINIWVKMNSMKQYPFGGGYVDQHIVSTVRNDMPITGYAINAARTNVNQGFFGGGTWCTCTNSGITFGNMYLNEWNNISLVYDGNIMQGFQNGVLLNTSLVGVVYNKARITLGAREFFNTGPDFFFDGVLDNVRIYNRALTQSEISALYCENVPTPQITLTGVGLSTTTISGYTSQWYKDNVSISGANANLLSFPLSNGTYQVGYNGCSISQGLTFPTNTTPLTVTSVVTVTTTVMGTCQTVTVQGVSLLTEAQSIYPTATIYIYPNPTSGNISVIATNVTVSTIEVYNSLGVLVQTQSGSSINISGQPAGIYNVFLKDSSNRYLAGQKIIKQ